MKLFFAFLLCFYSGSSVSGASQVDDLLEDFTYNNQVAQHSMPINEGTAGYKEYGLEAEYRLLQERHKLYLLIGILIITPLFLLIVLMYIKSCDSLNSESVVHASGLVLIIQSTAFIVIAAPTSEQLTAAIGVLGAIAGYLFGTKNASDAIQSKRQSDK